jgi:glycosyltransferase involved in cell wall biosynthesis
MLSLIITGRDVGPYIQTCLGSVAANDQDDLEVVFVDDGSVDDTPTRVASFSRRIPRFRVVRHDTPKGLPAARNSGVQASSGSFIAFLDGDDWVGPRLLGYLAHILTSTGADFVRVDHVRAEGARRALHRAPEWRRGEVLLARSGIRGPSDYSMVDYPYTWAGAFHRRLESQGLLHQNPATLTAEDRPWVWRLHLQAQTYVVGHEAGHFYRRGLPASLSQTGDARQLHYLAAFSEVFDLVAADHDSRTLRPKAEAQFLAVAASHVARERRLTASLRRRHRRDLAHMLARHNLLAGVDTSAWLGEKRYAMLQSLVREGRSLT